MALKISDKQQTQNFRHNDEGVIFFQIKIGVLGFSTWKSVKTIENNRKKKKDGRILAVSLEL